MNKWVDCLHAQEKFMSDLPNFTAQVLFSSCLSCDILCKNATATVEKIIPIATEEVSNPRLTGHKYGKYMNHLCPLNPRTECWAHKRFCKHNSNCAHRRFPGQFKSLRWERVKDMYGVKYKGDKQIDFLTKEEVKELNSDEIKLVDKVYKISQVLTTTVDLVPNTEEGEDQKNVIKEFIAKYGQKVLTEVGGENKLASWFSNSEIGDSCFTFNEELVPKKKITATSVNKFFQDAPAQAKPVAKPAAKAKPKKEETKVEAETPTPRKRKRRK